MFHVSQVVSLAFSQNAVARNFLMSMRLYKELEPIWVERTEFFSVSGYLYNIRRLAPSEARIFALLSPRSNTWVDTQNFSSPTAYMGRKLGIFTSARAYIEGKNVYHCKLTGRRLTGSYLGRSRKPTAISLQGELGAYMEETVRRVKPRQQAVFEGGGSLEYF